MIICYKLEKMYILERIKSMKLKAVCSFLIVVIVSFFALPLYSQTLGDVDSDGSVSIVDALLVAQYYVGLNPVNFKTANADTNCDQSIDILDALLIARYYVGLITVFPGCTVTIAPSPDVTSVPSECPCAPTEIPIIISPTP
jgi:hypothetical protein